MPSDPDIIGIYAEYNVADRGPWPPAITPATIHQVLHGLAAAGDVEAAAAAADTSPEVVRGVVVRLACDALQLEEADDGG